MSVLIVQADSQYPEQTAVSMWICWSGRLATVFASATHVQSMLLCIAH